MDFDMELKSINGFSITERLILHQTALREMDGAGGHLESVLMPLQDLEARFS